LAGRLGHDAVFFDVDAIPPGRDFLDVLSERVGKCDALIAVIGRRWVSSVDDVNRRRLDDPNDFVRIEIEAALSGDVPVIPVLVDGAALPHAADLPDSLKKLVRRKAIEISHNRFESDSERLTDALARIEEEARGRPRAPAEDARAKREATAARTSGPADPVRGAARPRLALPVLAVAAVMVLLALGAGTIMHEWSPQSTSTSSDLVQRSAPVASSTSPSSAAGPAASPADKELVDASTLLPRPSAKLLDSAPNGAVGPAPSKEGLAGETEQQKVAAEEIDALSGEANSAAQDVKTDANPLAHSNFANAAEPNVAAESQQWLSRPEFGAELRKQFATRFYRDKAWGRCENGVPQAGAHWSRLPRGQHFFFYGTDTAGFNAKNAELSARGFTLQYDKTFQGCDGATHHQALRMKAG
jgi:TIR domain